MDTKTSSTPKLPSIRTYAEDLDTNRKNKGLTTSVVIKDDQQKIAAPKFVIRKKEIVNNTTIVKPVEEKSPIKTTPLPPLSTVQSKTKHITESAVSSIVNEALQTKSDFKTGATIITDTKRDRFKLIPAIISSFTSWLKAKKLSYTTKKAPQYTVPETTRRKGVIQKATGVTGKLTTSDFSSLQERIKQRKDKVTTVVDPDVTWSANTEPVFLLLEEASPTSVTNVQVIPKKTFLAIPAKTETPIVETPQNSTTTAEVIETVKEVPLVAVTKPVAPIVEIVPDEKILDTTPKEHEGGVSPQSGLPYYLKLLLVNTNTLVLTISGIILLLTLTAFYGYSRLATKDTYISDVSETESLYILDTPLKLVASADNDRSTLLSTLETVRNDTEGAFQLAFLFSGSTKNVIPPPILLSILNLPLESNFSRSISHIRFGYTDDDNPFLIMKVTDETTALGGLIASEETLEQNLAEIFSYDLELKASRFIDASLMGVDVRVLKNTNGNDLIIYGIFNNVVIIAKNSQDLTRLKDLIK